MEWYYRICCTIFLLAKILLGKHISRNDLKIDTSRMSLVRGTKVSAETWRKFIQRSVISNSDFEGFHYAGFLAEANAWILPSWIWTNAAIVRLFCEEGKIDEAKELISKLENAQQKCGGWIVRSDYDVNGEIPMLAPNDSAYIANNAFLSYYECTGETKYLEVARRCADWIISTARTDGLVYTGYNVRDEKWDKNCIIVDVGFTAGLFARLYDITNEDKYRIFLQTFVHKYIELFYDKQRKAFSTSVDENDRQQGGFFGRGQAWALEGLIPAYLSLKDNAIKNVIDETINTLLKAQCRNGGWPYNLSRTWMGEDCKAVSVIAKNLMEWASIFPNERIRKSAELAYRWCKLNTAIDGVGKGGIFSYCWEGAIVHNLHSSCAFVYASVYAIELENMLNDE